MPASQQGFTVLELMIATIISALLLMAGTAALVQVGRMFYRGVTMAHTQEVARTIIDEVSRPIQFSGVTPIPVTGTPSGADSGVFCVGTQRYTYQLKQQVGTGSGHVKHALWRDRKAASQPCTPVDLSLDQPTVEGQDLVSAHMRLMKFTAVPLDPSNPARSMWEVSVKVAYGDDDGTQDVFNNIDDPDTIACRGTFIGAQFCAVSGLNTAVTRLLK